MSMKMPAKRKPISGDGLRATPRVIVSDPASCGGPKDLLR